MPCPRRSARQCVGPGVAGGRCKRVAMPFVAMASVGQCWRPDRLSHSTHASLVLHASSLISHMSLAQAVCLLVCMCGLAFPCYVRGQATEPGLALGCFDYSLLQRGLKVCKQGGLMGCCCAWAGTVGVISWVGCSLQESGLLPRGLARAVPPMRHGRGFFARIMVTTGSLFCVWRRQACVCTRQVCSFVTHVPLFHTCASQRPALHSRLPHIGHECCASCMRCQLLSCHYMASSLGIRSVCCCSCFAA